MKRTIKILLISSYINVFAYALFSPLYAVFVQTLDTNITTITSAWGLYAFIQGIMIILFGKIEDIWKDKRLLIFIGYILLAIGALSFIFISNVYQLYLVQIVNAVGNGILVPAWKSIYSQYEDRGKEAQEWSLFDGGNLILSSIAAVIGGFLVRMTGFQALFIIIFLVQIVAASISLLLFSKKAFSRKKRK